jgi:tetratricopeptide (TPR) repeat protein
LRRLVLLSLLGIAGAAIGTPCRAASAEPVAAPAAAEAKARYDEGTLAYSLAQWDRAIVAFTRAYQLDPSPMLLFNVAQSYWKKGDNEQALLSYRRYLEADPRTEQRSRVEARIRELEAVLAATTEAAAPPAAAWAAPAAARAEEPRAGALPAVDTETRTSITTPVYRRGWFWAATGGLVLGAAAVALVARAGGGMRWDCGGACPLGTYPVRDGSP